MGPTITTGGGLSQETAASVLKSPKSPSVLGREMFVSPSPSWSVGWVQFSPPCPRAPALFSLPAMVFSLYFFFYFLFFHFCSGRFCHCQVLANASPEIIKILRFSHTSKVVNFPFTCKMVSVSYTSKRVRFSHTNKMVNFPYASKRASFSWRARWRASPGEQDGDVRAPWSPSLEEGVKCMHTFSSRAIPRRWVSFLGSPDAQHGKRPCSSGKVSNVCGAGESRLWDLEAPIPPLFSISSSIFLCVRCLGPCIRNL